MAVTGLANLSQLLLNQGTAQERAAGGSNTALAQATQANREDVYLPSQQSGQGTTAQDAGLFTAPQSSIFSPAANVLLQTTPAATTSPASGSPANGSTIAPETAYARPASTTAAVATANPPLIVSAGPLTAGGNTGGNAAPPNPGTNAPAPTTNAAASAANANNTPAATAAAPAAAATGGSGSGGAGTAASAASANTTTTATSLASTQEQLQTLNNTLESLGLTAAQINQLDQIASIINDFNPNFFTAMAYQLQTLAQNPQAAATPAAATTAATANGPAAEANTNLPAR
jgi:hypothetical protein